MMVDLNKITLHGTIVPAQVLCAIEQKDMDTVREQGSPNPYIDETYHLYAGLSAYIKPASILEIGVFKGYSLRAMLIPWPKTTAVGVDISLGGPNVTRNAVRNLQAYFPEADITYLEIDSQTQYDEVPEGPFDIVHIDGDHSYQAAWNDLEHFGTRVSDRGVVIVHDTIDPQVYQATMEFASRHNMDYRIVDNACGNILLARKDGS